MSREDIMLTGCFPTDPHIARMEMDFDHRVGARSFLLKHIPRNTVGAEFGVYTGLFSSLLAAEPKFTQVSFVDPWWQKFGSHYPQDWGGYTDFGRVATKKAYLLACERIAKPGLAGRSVEVTDSQLWLNWMPDDSLDWVYVDCGFSYHDKIAEFKLLDRKLRKSGLILGDDWWVDEIFTAVNDFIKTHAFDLVFAQTSPPGQWLLRRSYPQRHSEGAAEPWQNELRADLGLSLPWSATAHKRSLIGAP